MAQLEVMESEKSEQKLSRKKIDARQASALAADRASRFSLFRDPARARVARFFRSPATGAQGGLE
jgi:hypothetical protein